MLIFFAICESFFGHLNSSFYSVAVCIGNWRYFGCQFAISNWAGHRFSVFLIFLWTCLQSRGPRFSPEFPTRSWSRIPACLWHSLFSLEHTCYFPNGSKRVFPRIGGKPPKMDSANNGKPYEQNSMDLGGKNSPLFLVQHPSRVIKHDKFENCFGSWGFARFQVPQETWGLWKLNLFPPKSLHLDGNSWNKFQQLSIWVLNQK